MVRLRGSQWENPKLEKCSNVGILSILSIWGNEAIYWFVKCINTLKLYYIQECFLLCLWMETCQNRVLIHTGLIVRLVFALYKKGTSQRMWNSLDCDEKNIF